MCCNNAFLNSVSAKVTSSSTLEIQSQESITAAFPTLLASPASLARCSLRPIGIPAIDRVVEMPTSPARRNVASRKHFLHVSNDLAEHYNCL